MGGCPSSLITLAPCPPPPLPVLEQMTLNECGSQLGVRGLSPLLNGEMTLRAEAASPGLGPVEGPKGGAGVGWTTAHPTGVPPSHLCPWQEEEGSTPEKVDEFPNTSLDRKEVPGFKFFILSSFTPQTLLTSVPPVWLKSWL